MNGDKVNFYTGMALDGDRRSEGAMEALQRANARASTDGNGVLRPSVNTNKT